MRVVFWGSYDLNCPRLRILMQGIRNNGGEALENHHDIWAGLTNKNGQKAHGHRLRVVVRWLSALPRLIVDYMRLPRHDAVIVSSAGHLDILFLWPCTKLRGTSIIWDAQQSLYCGYVEEQRRAGKHHPLAYLLYAWEWLVSRAAHTTLLDTQTHGNCFSQRFRLDRQRIKSVFIGAEPEFFSPIVGDGVLPHDRTLTVLFYGQFTRAQGIETIIQAARLLANEPIQWVLIGDGEEAPTIRRLLEDQPLENVTWISWVAYDQLVHWIFRADICLGIFGTSARAANVIPKKVFQILSCGRQLLTRDSPAIRELLPAPVEGVNLIEPSNPQALVDAIQSFSRNAVHHDRSFRRQLVQKIYPSGIGAELKAIISAAK